MEAPDDPFPDGFDFIEGLEFESEEEELEEEPDILPEADEQVRTVIWRSFQVC